MIVFQIVYIIIINQCNYKNNYIIIIILLRCIISLNIFFIIINVQYFTNHIHNYYNKVKIHLNKK